MSLYISLCLFASLYISLCLFASLYISLPLFASLYVSLHLFMSLCVRLPLFVPLCLPLFTSLCVSVPLLDYVSRRSAWAIASERLAQGPYAAALRWIRTRNLRLQCKFGKLFDLTVLHHHIVRNRIVSPLLIHCLTLSYCLKHIPYYSYAVLSHAYNIVRTMCHTFTAPIYHSVPLLLFYWTHLSICMLCMYVWTLVIAPLQDFYSEALPTTARTLNRSFTPKRMSNCEWRTCPGSLRGGLRWIRTRNPPAARHRTYPYTTAPQF